MQSCSRFGALNSSYTLPSLSYQVPIFTWVKWSIWGEVPCPRTQHLNNVPRLRGQKHDISLKILHQAGFETARRAATSAERNALTIAPCPSLFVMFLFTNWELIKTYIKDDWQSKKLRFAWIYNHTVNKDLSLFFPIFLGLTQFKIQRKSFILIRHI